MVFRILWPSIQNLLKCRMDSFSLVSLSLKSPVTVNVIKLGLVKGTSRVKVLRSCSVLGSFDKNATICSFPLLRHDDDDDITRMMIAVYSICIQYGRKMQLYLY